MIKMLRDSGRSTFLGTNSLWDYTNTVMNFLCGPQTLDSGSTSNFEWLRYFEVVITGSAKPSFFHDENRANAFEVEPESGMLLNTDNGTPMPQVGGASMLPLKSLNKSCRVFQGANVGHLHKLLGIGSSSQVLYVGDHIYGDILRSKKVLGCSIHEEGCGFLNPKLSKSSLKATMPPSQCHVACGSRNGRSICSDDASTCSLF